MIVQEKPLMRKLQALRILTGRSIATEDIASQLVSDGALPKDILHELSVSYDKVETLFKHMELAQRSGKIDLLDYEWKLLPTQVITITIVTPHAKREFKYEDL